MAKVGDKFIIEIDSKMTRNGGRTLYGIKGFRSLVFDDEGIRRLDKVGAEDALLLYEKGKRDGMMLFAQKLDREFDIELKRLMDEVPKGWL